MNITTEPRCSRARAPQEKPTHCNQRQPACPNEDPAQKKFKKNFFCVEYKGSRRAKTIQKRTIVGGFMLPDFESESHSVVSNSLQPHGLYSPWNSPGQNTGVGSPSLLQGIYPTQGSNPGLSHWGWILHQLSYQGSPRILEWVACPFSRGSS